MTTATEIIAFLLPRRRKPVVEKVTGLPEGWAIWLQERLRHLGPISSRPIEAALAAWHSRRVIRTAKTVPTSRWRALRSLLWQGWDPPPKEERATRWIGLLGSLLLHLGFIALLLVISLIMLLPAPEDTETTRTQLTLIGRGTQGKGGGASPQPLDESAQTATTPAPKKPISRPKHVTPRSAVAKPAGPTSPVAASAPTSPPVVPPVQPPVPAAQAQAQIQPQPQPAPTPAPAPAAQPLQVTETPQPTQEFVLPPVTPPQLQVQMPQATPRVREIEPQQTVAPVSVQQISVQPTQVQTPAPPEVQVRQREIPTPAEVVSVQAPAIQALRPTAHQPEVRLRQTQPAQAHLREIPMPQDASAASNAADTQATVADKSEAPQPAQTPDSSTDNASSTDTSPTTQGSRSQLSSNTPDSGAPPSPVSGGQSAGSLPNAAGAGNQPGPEHGTPGPKTADDWGAGAKTAQGTEAGAGNGLQGLFNADGSAKLPSDLTGGRTVKPGVPGSRQQARIDADRAGKWLDRPAYGSDPTMSAKRSWIPGGTLLEDWVRAGIKKVDIPIPGTTTHIRCVVSILQAGGACGLFDPNMQDQPATARPPPDIPIKRNPIPEGS